MYKRKKLWLSVSATILSTSVLAACQPDMTKSHDVTAAEHNVVSYAISHGGEGEGSRTNDLRTDDLAYLSQLGLTRGHLLVGYQLYMADHLAHAKTHMKHPESELYADLIPAFEHRGSTGFATELNNLANAVNNDLGKEKVEAAYQQLITAIAANETVVSKDTHSPAKQLKLVASLLNVAAEEYAIAVVDGKMENAHEYQDAYGFTLTAQSVINGLEDGETKSRALSLIDKVMPLWPGLIPPETLTTEAGELYGASAKMDILALSL